MKIAVNTRLLLPGKLEGIGWFACQSLKRIVRAHPEVDFHFLFDRPYSNEFIFAPNVKPVRLFPPARHPFLYYCYFEQTLGRYLNKTAPDLFLSPDGFLSTRYRGKQLPVFHDLNFIHYPHFLPFLTRTYYLHFFPEFARKACRIATVSEFSKKDIARTFNYPEDKIDVVYNGVNQVFSPVDESEARAARQQFAGGRPYFVYIGSLHKRKNIGNMLRAFDVFRKDDPEQHKLVIVGAPMFGSGEVRKAFRSMEYKEDVLIMGRQYGDVLRTLVASSRALLLVSYFEGFGIPILEAMQCEVPVITSNVASMPEVAGDAALFAAPDSVDQIVGAMRQIVGDPGLREALIRNGRQQRLRFSWDQTAERLWHSMEKCISG
ncbi:MAG: glycosyltransferase family 4 protein [Bacteroidales bacterium]